MWTCCPCCTLHKYLYVDTSDWWVWSGFNENATAATWYYWKEKIQDNHQCLGLPLLHTHTHTRQSHWSCDQETFTRKSDWIKAVMSSYHQIEGINVFVSTDVINRTQEATRHRKVGWQTDPRTINRRRWKNYDQQAERDREWEWERKVLTPTLRVKIKTVVGKARETVISVLDIWYNVL